ncbi:MAG: methionyl-tRNA formyltransferase [Candidatus Midichloriaceae bacterium]|jgi:methionyl-tRNA formyltransferase
MKILFMGSPEFAIPTLEAIASSNNELIAVYTKPPKSAGRGLKETKSAVHLLADQLNVNIFTPQKLKPEEEINNFKSLKPDIVIVAAYGLIIPKEYLDIPTFGFINVHPSTLPRWRGAAPIQRTIMAGDDKTSICIMKMDAGLDTGDIILKHDMELDDQITGKELHDKCAKIGGDLILKTIDLFSQNKINLIKQSDQGITYAEKIMPFERVLDFNLSAEELNNKIRALSPKPGSYFIYKKEIVKIITAEVQNLKHEFTPGLVIDETLSIACKSGILKPVLLQRQGKKMLYTDAFLRGFPIKEGDILQK